MTTKLQNEQDIAAQFKSVQTRLSKAKERFSAIEGERKAIQENIDKMTAQYEKDYSVKLGTQEEVGTELNRLIADIATAESEAQRIFAAFNAIYPREEV